MLLNYLPDFMQDMKEVKILLSAEDTDLEALKIDVENVFKDQYFLEATENGLKHYEEMFGIVPKLTDTLETRRFRLLARFNESLPYTEISINKQLETLCGKDGYSIEVVFEEYRVIAKVSLTRKALFDEVKKLLDKVLPANLILDLSLMYNQHLTLKKLTHKQMNAYRHIDLREEVI